MIIINYDNFIISYIIHLHDIRPKLWKIFFSSVFLFTRVDTQLLQYHTLAVPIGPVV